jgi:hypothetical protein
VLNTGCVGQTGCRSPRQVEPTRALESGGLTQGLAEHREDVDDIDQRGRLVERDHDCVAPLIAQVDPALERADSYCVRAAGNDHRDGIEKGLVAWFEAEQLAQPLTKGMGHRIHPAGNLPETFGAVVDRIHRRHVRQQRLGGTDVRRRLLAPDVLFARGQRHSVRGVAVGIDRHTDEPAGHVSDVRLARGKERRVRPAIPQRDAEALRVAEDDVGPHVSWRRDQRQCQQVGSDGHQRTGRMRPIDQRPEVRKPAVGVGILQHDAEDVGGQLHVLRSPHPQREAERFRPQPQDVQHLWQASFADQQHRARRGSTLLGGDALHQRHRLGRGGRLVQQRRIRHLHPRQVAHHRLEVDQRLEAALRDLGLVRGVWRVPARVLHHHPQDDAWSHRVVVPETDVRAADTVGRCDLLQSLQVTKLGFSLWKVERSLQPYRRGDCFVNQGIERGSADSAKHGIALLR